MMELLEKLMAEEFEDLFQPASEEELEERDYYDEDELAEYFMNIPRETLVELYVDYVGMLWHDAVRNLIEELPDVVLHKLYMKIKDQKDYPINTKEIFQWAKEEHKKKHGKTD